MEGKSVFQFKYSLKVGSIPIINNNDISLEFARHFSNIFSINSEIKDYEYKKKHCINISLNINYNTVYKKLFNLSELTDVLSSLKPKSAMGCDFIYNIFQKLFPVDLLSLILEAVNLSWNNGIFPEKFKTAILLLILKPGKDASIVPLPYSPV